MVVSTSILNKKRFQIKRKEHFKCIKNTFSIFHNHFLRKIKSRFVVNYSIADENILKISK